MTGLLIICGILLVIDIVLICMFARLTKKNKEHSIEIDTTVQYVDNIDKKMKDMDKSFEKVASEYRDMKRDNTFFTGELHRIENMLVTLNQGFPVESKM